MSPAPEYGPIDDISNRSYRPENINHQNYSYIFALVDHLMPPGVVEQKPLTFPPGDPLVLYTHTERTLWEHFECQAVLQVTAIRPLRSGTILPPSKMEK